jgi:hypothetical protein
LRDYRIIDFVLPQPLLHPVVKLAGARILMRRHRLCVLKRAAIRQIGGDAGPAEIVIADRRAAPCIVTETEFEKPRTLMSSIMRARSPPAGRGEE